LKARLAERASRAVIGQDDPFSRRIAERLVRAGHRGIDLVSARERVAEGWYALGSQLVAEAPWTGPVGTFASLAGVGSLRGRHNIQNALAAGACALGLGVSAGEVAAALKTFPGLAHRLEEIGRLDGTLFINDSKATNADSTATALTAFERDVFWILGGRAKQGGISPLTALFPRVARAYLIGEASEEFAATLEGILAYERCGTLAVALAMATRDAARRAAAGAPEPVVLLSPACASYDQYPNFEVRGDHFRTLVAALPGIKLRQDVGR
jgi:UDP-N-acetylmuramoylalanine--D-glutamate ligase